MLRYVWRRRPARQNQLELAKRDYRAIRPAAPIEGGIDLRTVLWACGRRANSTSFQRVNASGSVHIAARCIHRAGCV